MKKKEILEDSFFISRSNIKEESIAGIRLFNLIILLFFLVHITCLIYFIIGYLEIAHGIEVNWLNN